MIIWDTRREAKHPLARWVPGASASKLPPQSPSPTPTSPPVPPHTPTSPPPLPTPRRLLHRHILNKKLEDADGALRATSQIEHRSGQLSPGAWRQSEVGLEWRRYFWRRWPSTPVDLVASSWDTLWSLAAMIFHMAHEADPQPFSGRREVQSVTHPVRLSSDACGSGPNGTSMRCGEQALPTAYALYGDRTRHPTSVRSSGRQMRIEAMIAASAHSTTALLMMQGEGKACDM